MIDSKLIKAFSPEGEYYWVRCQSESYHPMIAEKVKNGWFLIGTEILYRDELINIIAGPLDGPY